MEFSYRRTRYDALSEHLLNPGPTTATTWWPAARSWTAWMLLPQRRLTSTWRASRPLRSRLWQVLCRHAFHQLHGGSCCVPHLCPAELCQPSWVHWEDRVRQLPFGQQTHWGEASSGGAPRHHLQDGGWGASQVREAPPASSWWLQGPNEHWRDCRDAWGMEVGSQGSSPQALEEGDEGLGMGSLQQGDCNVL